MERTNMEMGEYDYFFSAHISFLGYLYNYDILYGWITNDFANFRFPNNYLSYV